MLQIDNLFFAFPGKEILKGISFEIQHGECVALIGPSGSGKTTLLKIISELLPFEIGSILINGSKEDRRPHITYLMQEDMLLPWRTVLQNVLLLTEFQRRKTCSDAYDLMDQLGLGELAEFFPHQLSGGQKKRVALARALLLKRPLLILDEPFTSIDTLRKEKLLHLIQFIKKQYGLTILLITHDFSEALALSDRLLFLNNGRIEKEVNLHQNHYLESDLKQMYFKLEPKLCV